MHNPKAVEDPVSTSICDGVCFGVDGGPGEIKNNDKLLSSHWPIV